MPRIVIVGCSGSGKTTLGRAIAERLGIPQIELDTLHHLKEWQPRPNEEFRALVSAATKGPDWVVDGNYRRTWDITWARADTLIWLNYDFPLVFSRAFRRTVRRVFTREALHHGNRETFRLAFLSHDSILLWIIRTHGLRRRRYGAIFAGDDWSHLRKIEFRHPREADAYVDALAATS